MPGFAGGLYAEISRPRPLLARLWMLALFISWLGDTAPRCVSDDAEFVAMAGRVLLASIVEIVALSPYRSRSIAAKPLLVAAAIVLLSLCVGNAGALAVPMTAHAGTIVAAAVLATGLSLAVACGGALFLLSDSLIALNALADTILPGSRDDDRVLDGRLCAVLHATASPIFTVCAGASASSSRLRTIAVSGGAWVRRTAIGGWSAGSYVVAGTGVCPFVALSCENLRGADERADHSDQ